MRKLDQKSSAGDPWGRAPVYLMRTMYYLHNNLLTHDFFKVSHRFPERMITHRCSSVEYWVLMFSEDENVGHVHLSCLMKMRMLGMFISHVF